MENDASVTTHSNIVEENLKVVRYVQRLNEVSAKKTTKTLTLMQVCAKHIQPIHRSIARSSDLTRTLSHPALKVYLIGKRKLIHLGMFFMASLGK